MESKMHLKSVCYSLSITGVLLLSGCASRCITLSSNSGGADSFGSGFGQLKASAPAVKVTNGDMLQGQVTVKNKKSLNEDFQYQVNWLDKSGYQVGQPQPWTPVEIYADLQKTIQLKSPSPQAVSYTISFCRVS